MVVTMLF